MKGERAFIKNLIKIWVILGKPNYMPIIPFRGGSSYQNYPRDSLGIKDHFNSVILNLEPEFWKDKSRIVVGVLFCFVCFK